MGKMKNKVLPVSVLVLFMLMCINACGISKSRDSADMVSELNNRIIEKVAENYEEGNISALDIVIVRIDFGSFSQDNASEIFVLCKILNTPHVAGLDKTVGILLDADSLEMVAYKEALELKETVFKRVTDKAEYWYQKPQHIKEYQHRKFSF